MYLDKDQTLKQSLLQTNEKQILTDKDSPPYQWVIDKFKELDYHEYDSQQMKEPIQFEQAIEKLHCTAFFFKKNQFMIVYGFESSEGEKTKFEFRDIDSGKLDRVYIHPIKAMKFVSHQFFNGKDYICMQLNQNLFIYDLEKIENLENYQVKIELKQSFSFRLVQILDEFNLLCVGSLSRMTNLLLLVNLKDSISSFPAAQQELEFGIDDDTFKKLQGRLPPHTPLTFTKIENQNLFHYLPVGGLVKMLQPGFNNQISFNFQKRNYVFDYKTTNLVKDFEWTKIIAIQNEDLRYSVDIFLNIYTFDQAYEFTKIKKLCEFDERYQLSNADFTKERLILKLKQERFCKYIVIDAHSFEFLNEINHMNLDYTAIDPDRNYGILFSQSYKKIIIYDLRSSKNDFVNLYIPQSKGKPIYSSNFKSIHNDTIFFENPKESEEILIQDLNENFPQRIVQSSNYLNAVNSVKRDISILGRPEEFVQRVTDFPQTEVFDLLSTDTILFKEGENIQLNGDRFIKLQSVFKDNNGMEIGQNNCCIMSDRFNGPSYVLWIPDRTKIVYFNKNTQETTTQIATEDMPRIEKFFRAWIDFDLNLLILNLASSFKACVFLNLTTLQEDENLKYACSSGLIFSIYLEENLLQISNPHIITFNFYKNQIVCKTIIFKHLSNDKYEGKDGYQEQIHQPTHIVHKKKGASRVYYIQEFNSINKIKDFKSYNQPIVQSLYFQHASKIEIDGNQIRFYIRNEDKPVGFFTNVIFLNDIINYQKLSKSKIEEALDKVMDIKSYINHISGFGNCFNIFENNFIALEYIMKQLGIQDKESLPILIAPPMYGKQNPLDIAIQNRQQKVINLMMSALTKYQDHILFNEIVDKNLCSLIKEQIDLVEYFESSMPKYQIFDSKFPIQHSDESNLIVGINLENPKDIHDKYEQLFADKLEVGKGANVSIEYFLVNLPQSIRGQSTEFMKTLNETTKLEYFEHETIQHIINFKWDNHTQHFYKVKFYIYMLFMISFIFETLYQTYNGKLQYESEEQPINDTREEWLIIGSKSLSSIVLLYFIGYELTQIRNQRLEYFKETWNIFDFSHFLTYIALSILEFQDVEKDILIIGYISIR
ncbi:UNKNOWN [Stylonychia lemnae]|uniref:Wd-40 repeat protein n=1 Tax=Stylonychia lemnae TaxID=5949 RepID=A0A078AK97_STYLE|nr:UNKNOWN [Stylonychia lemnae]|eukprot:CDW81228.1 UNKNOWN [Stylonychia lemnae]